jgi:hypothetical protein
MNIHTTDLQNKGFLLIKVHHFVILWEKINNSTCKNYGTLRELDVPAMKEG